MVVLITATCSLIVGGRDRLMRIERIGKSFVRAVVVVAVTLSLAAPVGKLSGGQRGGAENPGYAESVGVGGAATSGY